MPMKRVVQCTSCTSHGSIFGRAHVCCRLVAEPRASVSRIATTTLGYPKSDFGINLGSNLESRAVSPIHFWDRASLWMLRMAAFQSHPASQVLMKRAFLVIFLLAVAAAGQQTAVQNSPASSTPPHLSSKIGADVFARASLAQDIRLGDTLPFKLAIRIKLLGLQGGDVSGLYARLYESDQKWRAELVIPPYKRAEWGGVGGYWREREAAMEPAPIRELDRLIAYAVVIKQHSEIHFTAAHDGKHQDKPVDIVEGKWMDRADWKYFFDKSNGVLLRIEFPASRFEYSDFQPFGNKLFPRRLQAYHRDQLVIDAQVSELTHIENSNPVLYAHASGAELHPTCEGLKWPEPLQRQDGLMPASMALRHLSGDAVAVVVTGVVGIDGKFHNSAVSRSAGDKDADERALDVIRSWTFRPAMCGNDPVELEVEMAVRLKR